MADKRPPGVIAPPDTTTNTRDEYGLTADESKQGVSHGYEFFGVARQKDNPSKPMTVHGALNTFIRFANGTPQQRAAFAQIQKYLYLGGFYSNKNYVPTFGAYRTEDIVAMKKALLSASAGKGPGKAPLAEFFKQQAELYQQFNPPSTRDEPVLTIQYTDPTDIRRIIERTAPDVLGHDLTDDEKARLIDAYHQLEAGAQRDAFNAQNGAGGSFTAPPDPSAFIEHEAEKLHPTDAHVTSLANLSKQVLAGLQGQGAMQGERVF